MSEYVSNNQFSGLTQKAKVKNIAIHVLTFNHTNTNTNNTYNKGGWKCETILASSFMVEQLNFNRMTEWLLFYSPKEVQNTNTRLVHWSK